MPQKALYRSHCTQQTGDCDHGPAKAIRPPRSHDHLTWTGPDIPKCRPWALFPLRAATRIQRGAKRRKTAQRSLSNCLRTDNTRVFGFFEIQAWWIFGGMERFTRLRKVGSGSFGEVYEGLDNETGEAVAIKASRLPPGDPLILTLTLTCAAGVFLKMKVAEVLHTWHLCTLPQGKCCLLALTRWNSFHPLLPSGV